MGFSWLELRHADEQGVEHYVTLALIVRANKGESGVHCHFALLEARRAPGGELVGPRIGVNAFLTHEHHPISRSAFAELAGELIETASVYRERVNALLFGLPQDRYEALIRLLLSLRKPQLSQTLDPDELSARLTEALPELDRDAVVRVSSRLDQLDRLRDEAKQLREVREAVAAFARTYRDWARAALRERGAALVRSSEALERERAAALAAARELRASEGWQAAERLEELRRLAQRAQAAAAAAAAELARAQAAAEELAGAAAQAREALAAQQVAMGSLSSTRWRSRQRRGVLLLQVHVGWDVPSLCRRAPRNSWLG